MTATYGAMLIGCGILVMTSCGRPSETPVATTTTTSARRIINDDAAILLTGVRCAHEATCADLGTRSRFADKDACARELFPETQLIVRPDACPNGVDEAKLTRCITDVRSQRCEAKELGIEDVASCRQVELCATPRASRSP
jgi:hypothetical protein